MKPYACSLTSEGISVLMVPAATILIQGIDRDEYWQVREQLRAWDLVFSGDEVLVKGGLRNVRSRQP